MPKPDTLGLTWEDVQKEIADWPDYKAKPRSIDALTEEHKRILCGLMRSGKKMDEISAWWERHGLKGSSPNTLRRMFAELKKQGY